jgi:hypothetical protein
MSRSIFRGPLSLTFTLPSSFSMLWSRSNSSVGLSNVRICMIISNDDGGELTLVIEMPAGLSYLTCAVDEIILILNIHSLCFPKAAGPLDFDVSTALH